MSEVDDEQSSMPPGPAPATVADDPGIAVSHEAGSSLLGAAAELRDADLQLEIELVSAVVLAASASSRPLTTAEIDRALGLTPV